MRVNDKVLVENINDYFTHKGLSPNLIDDIKVKLKKDFQKSEEKDEDYIEYRKKSPAEVILTIQRNLFTLQLNPIVFFILNFILLSYLYDKQFVPFQAATGLSIFYCLIILPISIFIIFSIAGLYFRRLEFTGIGLLLCQKTIDAMISSPEIAQIGSIVIWFLLLIVIIYYTIRISSRN